MPFGNSGACSVTSLLGLSPDLVLNLCCFPKGKPQGKFPLVSYLIQSHVTLTAVDCVSVFELVLGTE
jgi:hypothetical protein